MNLPTQLPPSVDKAVENLTDKPTEVIGRGVAAIVSLVFSPIIHLSDKQQAKYLRNLEIYKQEINSKIAAIPDENYIEPKLQIAAQALEDSKYCIEEPDLREMFANLIASASDKTKVEAVHPSFSAILRQMSPRDAAVMRMIKQGVGKYSNRFPVATIKSKLLDNKGEISLAKNVIVPDLSDITKIINQDSLSSLLAFGLIDIDYSKHMASEGAYEHFERFAEATGYKTQAENLNGILSIGKGNCELTVYGQNFARSCGL